MKSQLPGTVIISPCIKIQVNAPVGSGADAVGIPSGRGNAAAFDKRQRPEPFRNDGNGSVRNGC